MNNSNLIDQLSLWNHQKEAVTVMHNYISNYYNNNTNGSALVHMPTGSGKTGVIATLARCIPEVKCVLILTTRVAIREQLARNIKHRFFEQLEESPELAQLPKEIVEIEGSFASLEYSQIENTVFITTIQKIQYMEKKDVEQFEILR